MPRTLTLLLLASGSALASAPYTEVPFLSDAPVREFSAPEQVLEEGKDYAARLETSEGTLLVDLLEDETPETVNNFIFLARQHFYDGVVFHRVLDGFMAQTGDPTGTGTGGPGYEFADEITERSFDRAGLVAMANAGPGTNGSQFFITFAETPHLDGAHTIFGEVTEGAEVLAELERIDPSQPSAVAQPSDPVSVLAEQGVALAGADPDVTVEAYLSEQLGALPGPGERFTLEGAQGVVGQGAEGETLVGFFPEPDTITSVTILERPK